MNYIIQLDSGQSLVANQNYVIAATSNEAPPNISADLLNLTNKILEIQQTTENKIDQLIYKVDRQNAELISLRNEIGTIKARVCGKTHLPKVVLPISPFTTLADLAAFEENLKNEKIFNDLVIELVASEEKTYDKFIRTSWRQIIKDEIAKECSWRGTETKIGVKGLLTTLAIRNAFNQKFGLDDKDFDLVTKKYFQYAQERTTRAVNSESKKMRM
ncbi:uncharacterized protein [Eurosta solidaginis]|uniref:uncharacterized protein n=1 Tax=Eurosta solidaginis TaxID=178769 RepID=UPI003531619A